VKGDTRGIALDRATQLEGEGENYSIALSRAWEIWGPNGGYLAAIALRAAGMRAEIARPASFYCHFLRSPDFDRVELDVSFLKRSRRSEALAVQMTQQGRPVLQALVRTAADAPGYEHQQVRAPEVPPPERLRDSDELLDESSRPPFRFWENIERRPIDWAGGDDSGTRVESERPTAFAETDHPSALAETDHPSAFAETDHPSAFAETGHPSAIAETRHPSAIAGTGHPAVAREWTRFRPRACFDDPFVDAARPLILLDTYGWPAAYRTYRGGPYIAPNLDTSAWFHQLSPHSEWLLIEHACTIASHGLLGVGGRVWDEDGRLLADGGAQLCCMPAPLR
jgi:acyl-CoA thioesterase